MTDNAVILEVLREQLRTRGEVLVPPAGFSMGPRYRRVSGLVLQSAPDRLRAGDVVAFARGDRWVLHRVLAVRGEVLWTKGDAVATLDQPPARRDEVVAVLVARVRDGRRYAERRGYAWWAVARSWLQVMVGPRRKKFQGLEVEK